MTIPCSLYPLGTSLGKYKHNEVLCDLSNGQTAELTLYPGLYYIRGQGAGGSGGNCGYSATGGGGGSGAVFDGYVRVLKKKIITVTAGNAPTKNSIAGGNTVIENMMTLNSGQGGGDGTGQPGAGGLIDILEQDWFNIVDTLPHAILNGLPGNNGVVTGTNYSAGANSALTGTGGGKAGGGGQSGRSATAPGAGGAGGIQFDTIGGLGFYGECFIKYVSP